MDEPKANLKQFKTPEEVEQMQIIREDFQRPNELEMDWNDSLEVDGNPNTLYSRKGTTRLFDKVWYPKLPTISAIRIFPSWLLRENLPKKILFWKIGIKT